MAENSTVEELGYACGEQDMHTVRQYQPDHHIERLGILHDDVARFNDAYMQGYGEATARAFALMSLPPSVGGTLYQKLHPPIAGTELQHPKKGRRDRLMTWLKRPFKGGAS
jgi:hypothetical protein